MNTIKEPDVIERLMPEPVKLGTSMSGVIHQMLLQRQHCLDDPDIENPAGLKTVMGYVIPTWQRKIVWNQEQMIKFIESIWKGLPLGTYTYNRPEDIIVTEYENLLIDGQQRLTAIERYIDGDFKVFGHYYEDTTIYDKRKFKSTTFASYVTHSVSEKYLRSYYNLMNFSGVAHKENERA